MIKYSELIDYFGINLPIFKNVYYTGKITDNSGKYSNATNWLGGI